MNTTTIIRIPNVGEKVEVYREDHGDAGLKLIVGTQGTITQVDKDENTDDWTFTVMVDGIYGREDSCEHGWTILAEYGKNGSDFYNGKSTLEAFWSVFQSKNEKNTYMRWAVVHGSKSEPLWSAPARQGRYTYGSYEEALQSIKDMVANSSEDTLRQVFGEGFGTWRPALYEVYSETNQDPKRRITDTLGMKIQ